MVERETDVEEIPVVLHQLCVLVCVMDHVLKVHNESNYISSAQKKILAHSPLYRPFGKQLTINRRLFLLLS